MIRRIISLFVRRTVSLFAAGAFAIPLTGCDSVLSAFVGEPHGPQGIAKSSVPPFNMGYGFTPGGGVDSQSAKLAGQTILPPTVPLTQDTYATEETAPVGEAGPRPPIAVARLAADPMELSRLGAAAAHAGGRQDAHFVLLVLTPLPADAAAIGRMNTQSRAAADAAVKAITDAGIAADRVEVSAATSADTGEGEMRLYVR